MDPSREPVGGSACLAARVVENTGLEIGFVAARPEGLLGAVAETIHVGREGPLVAAADDGLAPGTVPGGVDGIVERERVAEDVGDQQDLVFEPGSPHGGRCAAHAEVRRSGRALPVEVRLNLADDLGKPALAIARQAVLRLGLLAPAGSPDAGGVGPALRVSHPGAARVEGVDAVLLKRALCLPEGDPR